MQNIPHSEIQKNSDDAGIHEGIEHSHILINLCFHIVECAVSPSKKEVILRRIHVSDC